MKHKEIYFDKLKSLKLSSIGLFGSRQEVLSMLKKYDSISTSLYNKLIRDEENITLAPGIHAILPIDIHKNNKNKKWNKIIYLFYCCSSLFVMLYELVKECHYENEHFSTTNSKTMMWCSRHGYMRAALWSISTVHSNKQNQKTFFPLKSCIFLKLTYHSEIYEKVVFLLLLWLANFKKLTTL